MASSIAELNTYVAGLWGRATKVIELLEDHHAKPHDDDGDTYLTMFELAEAMTPAGREPDVSLVESIRRAVKRLAADGVLDFATVLVSRDVQGRARPMTKRMLAARMGGER
ncbi:MAG TPA: hypothetical protein VGH54_15255 [Mycobacterium sp.]|uniref:hypothetical protein n=1 Tax=Mycobacterium sp. TaxID=1785 RepID=UPI002F40FCC7